DRAVEDLIRAEIAKSFPEDGILGEEHGEQEGSSGWIWVVDPIDGTASFLAGLRDWCISIAAVKNGVTEIGMILQPTTGDLYVARKGAGALLNGRQIAVRPEAQITRHPLGFGTNPRVPPEEATAFIATLLGAGGMFYRNGSGALMLAYVAAGRLCGYYEAHINAWDCLAGLLLIREAGGWARDYPGADVPLSAGGPVLACVPGVRASLIRLVGQAKGAEPARG
ncbi:inositol monophosphatase, partial [Thioclava sp. BHET1]